MLKTLKQSTVIENRRKIEYFFLITIIISFFIPYILLTNILIAIFGVYTFTIKDNFIKLKDFISKPIPILFISFYLLHLIGLIYTSNKPQANEILENRVLLLVFPLIIYAGNLDKKRVKKLLYVFAYSTIAFGLFGLVYRLNYYLNINADTGYFYNDNIIDVFGFQAVYYAIFVNLSIFILYDNLLKSKFSKIQLVLQSIAILFLFFLNYLLASRTSMLSLYAIFGVYNLVYIINNKKYKLGLALIVLFVGLIASLLIIFPKTLNRFDSVLQTEYDFKNTNEINHFNAENSDENWNGLNTRLAIWECTSEIISDNFWFGVGTGDYEDELNKKYREKEFQFAIESGYLTHNMYLNVLLLFGIVGLIIFSLFLIIPFSIAIKDREYFYVLFLVIMMIAMITEDLFNRSQGVFVFTLFNSLLAFKTLPSLNKNYQIKN